MRSIRPLLLLLLGSLAIILAACGSVGSSSTANTDTKAITINVRDNYFDPKNIQVPANQPVKVTFTNKGTNPHIVEIKGLISETTMQPGETKTFTITPHKQTYKLYDELYDDKGMEGTFVGN